MAYIQIETKYPLYDGKPITFKAPCDSSETEGLTVGEQNFVFKDLHGGTLTGVGNLFLRDALVKVILDVTDGSAYIQNADTNAYLERKFETHPHAASSITGGTFAGQVVANRGDEGQTPGQYLVRNSKLSLTEETPTNDGEICWTCE